MGRGAAQGQPAARGPSPAGFPRGKSPEESTPHCVLQHTRFLRPCVQGAGDAVAVLVSGGRRSGSSARGRVTSRAASPARGRPRAAGAPTESPCHGSDLRAQTQPTGEGTFCHRSTLPPGTLRASLQLWSREAGPTTAGVLGGATMTPSQMRSQRDTGSGTGTPGNVPDRSQDTGENLRLQQRNPETAQAPTGRRMGRLHLRAMEYYTAMKKQQPRRRAMPTLVSIALNGQKADGKVYTWYDSTRAGLKRMQARAVSHFRAVFLSAETTQKSKAWGPSKSG